MTGVPSPSGFRATSRRSGRFETATLLDPAEVTIPDLGHCPLGGEWSEDVRRYWESLWVLPQSPHWAPSDIESLRTGLLVLKERIARLPAADLPPDRAARLHVQLSAEVRLQEQRFHLSPLDRQRGRLTLVLEAPTPPSVAEETRALSAPSGTEHEAMSQEWLDERGLL